MLLDRRCWREWLDLYSEDSVFWMPAWLDEDTTTSDPDAELSHIYYKGRHNLEDRVWRGGRLERAPLLRRAGAGGGGREAAGEGRARARV